MKVGDLVRFRGCARGYLVTKVHAKNRVSLSEHHPLAIFMMCDLKLISESKEGTNEKKNN